MRKVTKEKENTDLTIAAIDNNEITQVMQFTETRITEINDISKKYLIHKKLLLKQKIK